jgi:FkbM family methyltransferase
MFEQLITLAGRGKQVQFKLHLDPSMQPDSFLIQHFEQGACYEPELVWVMFRTLCEGNIALDVGANIGFFTLLMSRLVGETGKVLACEPGVNNLGSLQAHLKTNGAANVSVEERPIWCNDEPVTFYLNADNRSSNALYDPGNWPYNEKSRANPQPVTLDGVTIDTAVRDVDGRNIKLIKIDTEGAEQKVLEGASNLLAMFHPPYILAELNPHGLRQSGCDTESLRAYMRTYEYEMFIIHRDDKLPSLVPQGTKIKYVNDIVSNVLFSDLENVGKAWPECMGDG